MRFVILFLSLLATHALAETRTPNHLAGSESPYLLQHQYNPVDWYPWGSEALEKAQRENKLVFLSVGYASCHWCHVMEDESFENQAIADFLNKHFVSIKVDRERRPDLDEQFQLVTQTVSGGGGWPNTVFLTPDAAPFYGGTYYPPDIFTQVLHRIVELWQQDPQSVQAESDKLVRVLGAYMTRQAKAADMTPQAIKAAATATLAEIDDFNGGLGTAPKFPQESLFLFLLDQADRTGDPDLLQASTGVLDGMIMGGIHDHVGGGFHRYATDPEWKTPHFEKMLYTQAMTGRLLLRAWAATDEPRYRRAAERLADYVMREMRDGDGGFYSAQDADSLTADGEKREGVFFTWTPSDLNGLGDSGALITSTFQITDEGDLDGGNILNLAELPQETATAHGLSEAAFYARLDPILTQMRDLRASRSPPATDQKIVLAWNAAMIETLAEASHLLNRPDLFDAAEQSARFILNTLKTETGFHRVSYQGRAGVAAQLADYGALGLAFVALHDFASKEQDRDFWLEQAKGLAALIRANFGDVATGFRMTETTDGFTAQIPVDDTELPSGNALALALFTRLSDRLQAPDLETAALTLMATLSGHALEFPDQRASILHAADALLHGATGPVQFAGAGAVRVVFARDRDANTVQVQVALRDGWHVNAPQPLEDYLVPTSLAIDGHAADGTLFPKAQVKSFGFSNTPLAVLEGGFTVTVPVPEPVPESTEPDAARHVVLQLQPCNDEVCLEPQELRFTLW